MEILALIIPAIIVAIYIGGQQSADDYGDEIMRARSRRIADREAKERYRIDSPSDIIAQNGNRAILRDGTMVETT